MKEVKGNIWDYHSQGNWVVITTNGTVRSGGEAVMGRGVASQAKSRFPVLALQLGRMISEKGNVLHCFPEYGIISFPVKHSWWERADFDLIEKSAAELIYLFDSASLVHSTPICIVRPGCGNGGLNWSDVKPILEKYLDDRFMVVDYDLWR